MTAVNIDLRQLSGTAPGVEPKPDAEVWFTPYRAYHVEDGDDDYLVTTQILEIELTEGAATIDLPPTPAGHALWVQLRKVRHAPDKWLVAIPEDDCNLFDLEHLDPETLDPETPLSPAWLAALEALTTVVGTKATTAALTTETNARTAADTTNATAIAAETTDRVTADATNATAAATALSAANAAQTTADSALEGLDTKADTADLATVATTGQYVDMLGTVPTSALPDLAITDVTVVATQAEMLALVAQRGDVAVRTDTSKTYILSSNSPTTLADWKEITAAGAVTSVAGKTGTVALTKSDVGLALADNTDDASKPVSVAQAAADALKQDIATLDDDTKIIQQTRDQKQARALRNFHVALGTVATTAVDALLVSDSIGEGANAGTWAGRFINVVQDRVRRAIQPAGVTGGTGYFGFGSALILTGSGFIGHTGTAAATTAFGLGRKSLVLQNAATWSFYFVGDACDLLYSTDPTYGSFTLTVNGVAQGGTTVCSGATSHGNKKRLTGTAGATNTVIVTSTGITALEGEMPYNGDTTTGFRMWEGAHAAFSSADYVSSTAWADSVTAIPNLRLVLMTGNSNAYYAGTPVATAKSDQLDMIARVRSKGGSNASYVLVSYYDRPATTPVAPWADYVAAYDEIADADPDVMHIDLGPTFGPLVSQTDDRGGLTSNVDFVHPTPAGHVIAGAVVGGEIIPRGIAAGRLNKADVGLSLADNVADASKPVSALQAAADTAVMGDVSSLSTVGNFGAGAIILSGLGIPMRGQTITITLTALATLAASGMPTVPAGKTGSFWLEVTQGGAGSFGPTINANILKAGGVALVPSTTPGSVDLYQFRNDGARWIVTAFIKGVA